MKATEVRVLPALEPGESYVEPSFLLVETTADGQGDTVTTIDHVADSPNQEKGWSVRTLGHSVPMSHPAAREWAVAYAASRGIPLVYERDETADSQPNRSFE